MPFTFHANTLAFGGQIDESNGPKYLPSQASAILPPTGGYGETVSGPYDDGDVSFRSAKSNVTGSSYGDTYSTYANTAVFQLNIAGRIRADVLTSTVTSKNERDADGCMGESQIRFEANIIGLVIDGHPIDVDFNPEPFRRHATYAEFVDSFKTMSEEDVTAYAAAYNWPMEECQTVVEENGVTRKTFHVPRRCTTGIRASLLRQTTPRLAAGEISGLTRRGFTIEVAGFGLLHLGEVLIKAGRRRVNLLRVELNKTLDGAVMNRVVLPDAGSEPRLVTTAFSTAPEAFTLTGGTGGGSYTFATGEGNGTDFVP
jgi:hypothetical protein